jgi:Tol biopolymer transport system component
MRRGCRGVVLASLVAALSLTLVPAAGAAFPGANGLIVFGRDLQGQTELYTLDPVTGVKTRLTTTKWAREGLADWNADGTKIAYSRCGRSEFANCDIWVMNADGTGQTRITQTTFQETWPAWSPDGERIAYTTNESDESQDIWVMDADGSNPMQLTTFQGFDAFPEWSPDGERIAFTSDRMAFDDIWLMDPDGTHLKRLTFGDAIDERPDWSPDGTTIAFSRNGNLWTIGAAGGAATKLTANPRNEFGPAFSPDGSQITYSKQTADDRIGIWTMDADGTNAHRRTFSRFDFFPDWGTDSL